MLKHQALCVIGREVILLVGTKSTKRFSDSVRGSVSQKVVGGDERIAGMRRVGCKSYRLPHKQLMLKQTQ